MPLWQIDCDEYRKVGRDFELRDIGTPDHESFCAVFSARHNWHFKLDGNKAIFSQKPFSF